MAWLLLYIKKKYVAAGLVPVEGGTEAAQAQ